MQQHQRSKVCRLKFAGVLLSHLYDRGVLISLEIDSILAGPPYSNLSTGQTIPVVSTFPPPCPGASISWVLGSPYLTYPFAIHAPTSRMKPGYALLDICSLESRIHTRSNHCAGSAINHPSLSPCTSCQGTAILVRAVEEHARKPPTNLDRMSLSHEQLGKRLENMEKKKAKESLKVRIE